MLKYSTGSETTSCKLNLQLRKHPYYCCMHRALVHTQKKPFRDACLQTILFPTFVLIEKDLSFKPEWHQCGLEKINIIHSFSILNGFYLLQERRFIFNRKKTALYIV